MSNPLVSIIVPVFNQGEYLSETLDSVLNQNYNKWECIIINDGSTDDSEQIALDYCNKDHRFSYYYQSNQGVVCARNYAIKKSKGIYILPLDADDIISSEYLDLAVDVMEKHPDVKLVYCDIDFFGAKTGKGFLMPLTKRNILKTGCCVCTSLFRRDSFDQIGGFKNEMKDGWEDWEFFISLMELEGRAYKIEKCLFHYRVVNKSRNRSISPEVKDSLRCRIVSLHPQFYYKEYDRLLADYHSIVNSRSYIIFNSLMNILRKLYVHN